MQQLNLEESYDVVIIGAGVAGLTAAALLAKTGMSVCVLEAGAIGGGYLQGFRRKDFRFDTAIHWLNQYEPGGMICMTFDILGNDYPKAIPQKRIKRYKGDGFDYLLTNNPDELKRQWQQEFPEDAEGLDRFFKAAKKIGRSFKEFGHVFRSEETMTFFERMRNKKNLLRFVLPFIPHIRFSGEKGTKKGLDKYFKSPGLRKVFSSDTELLSCLVPIGWAYYGDYQSPPKGGGQRITEWLTHVIRTFGYEVYYKCRVKQILVENGVSKGVVFDHRGTDYTLKSKYVIAACDVETLYEQMLPEAAVPAKMKDRLRAAELYPSSVTVSIALDCPVEQLGFNEEMIHLAGIGTPHEPKQDGNPKTTEICILAPTFRDPSLAPAGQGTLSLHMPALWDYEQQWMTEKDEAGQLTRGEKYKELKTWLADILIDRVEAMVAPGLRSHILFYDVATPVTHWRYSGNRGGTMMGAKPGRANMQNKIAHYQTPVKNLFLGGHWAELGGGVPIAVKAAANASLMIMKQEDPAAFQVFKDYMDSKISLDQLFKTGVLKLYPNNWSPLPTPAEKKVILHQQQAAKKSGNSDS
jgi:phytoene dehydrogenase-like protein